MSMRRMACAFVVACAIVTLARTSHAVVAAPTLEAADRMGHEVAGEIEFDAGHDHVSPTSLHAPLAQITHSCPQKEDSPPLHLLLLAWSDHEFPANAKGRPTQDVQLAQARGESVQHALENELPPSTSYDIVNMATRAPQHVRVGLGGRHPGQVVNLKKVLLDEGAAPTDRYQIGLFGEYAQSHKVVLWINCDAPAVHRKRPRLLQVMVAANPLFGSF